MRSDQFLYAVDRASVYHEDVLRTANSDSGAKPFTGS
jgi:hypothetical protein